MSSAGPALVDRLPNLEAVAASPEPYRSLSLARAVEKCFRHQVGKPGGAAYRLLT